MIKKAFFGLSDIGLERPNNEDVWTAIPEIGFYAIADGMGGHLAGEVAAKETIDHISKTIQTVTTDDCVELIIELRTAIEKANTYVYKMSKQSKEMKGMGTTLCCLVWKKDFIVYAHVGDSRIYRLRNQKLELLTQDHSFLAKWLSTCKHSSTPYPYKNVITKAVGTSPKVHPEITFTPYIPGDLFFLCTDGLTDVLCLEEIQKIICESPSIEFATENLIEEAKFKGSSDNITLVMIQSENSETNLFRQQCDNSLRPTSLPGYATRS